MTAADFHRAYTTGKGDPASVEFRSLQLRTRAAIGRTGEFDGVDTAYDRYLDWLPFQVRRQAVLRRITAYLGYDYAEVLVPTGNPDRSI